MNSYIARRSCGPRSAGAVALPHGHGASINTRSNLSCTCRRRGVGFTGARATGDKNLSAAIFKVGTRNTTAQTYFDNGLRMTANFVHAEAVRSFLAAQKPDMDCALCFGAEAWALELKIKVPMAPDADAPALAALQRAQALAPRAPAPNRDLIAALNGYCSTLRSPMR